MKMCCFHGTTSKLYCPRTRPQGFFGIYLQWASTSRSGILAAKKGPFSHFFPKISFWMCFGISWGFPGLFLDCSWSPGRMPWGLLPIFGGAFPKECPGAWHPFLVEAFQKKEPGAWHPFLVEAFHNRGLGPGTL